MKDLSAHTQYAFDRIKNFSFKRTAESFAKVQVEMIQWRKGERGRYQNWAFSSLPRFEFMTLLIGSYFQEIGMTVKEITSILKVSEKTVYEMCKIANEEGWVDCTQIKKCKYYKASQLIIDQYYEYTACYMDAVHKNQLKENYELVVSIEQYLQMQSAQN
jgi:hypothetical protein